MWPMYRLAERKWCTLAEAREQPLDVTIEACAVLDALEAAERESARKAAKR